MNKNKLGKISVFGIIPSLILLFSCNSNPVSEEGSINSKASYIIIQNMNHQTKDSLTNADTLSVMVQYHISDVEFANNRQMIFYALIYSKQYEMRPLDSCISIHKQDSLIEFKTSFDKFDLDTVLRPINITFELSKLRLNNIYCEIATYNLQFEK